jgi:hypothetical protein
LVISERSQALQVELNVSVKGPVQEGFTVNKTTDQKGTQYKHLDLTSCTNSDRDTTLLTFQELSDSSRKNKQLTP